MDEHEAAIVRGQLVVDDNVQPLAVRPEVEVEDSRVLLRSVRTPLLVTGVGDHLRNSIQNVYFQHNT